ncbi:MAG: YkgJ family cysteine cluster protein [Desulfuromonadaceae bacterium]|nr:YkgJ family cysteine cluster protein [Desulfuromonadaceae bacterium]
MMKRYGVDFYVWRQQLEQDWHQVIQRALKKEQLNGALEQFLDAVEQKLERKLTPHDSERIACRAGCGTCCQVHVAVLQPEAENIAAYLKENWTSEQLETLQQRMQKMLVRIEGLDEVERAAVSCSCVFLSDEGSCSIYPVRPLLCRSLTSTCSESCRQALRMQALGESCQVEMNLFQKELFDTAYLALASIWQRCGKDHRGYELTAAVSEAL